MMCIPRDLDTSRTFWTVGTMSLTEAKISGFPHWIDPKPLGSTKSRCMSIITNAVVAGGKLYAYGRALGRESLVIGAMSRTGLDEFEGDSDRLGDGSSLEILDLGDGRDLNLPRK